MGTSQWYLSKLYYILQVQFQVEQKEGERGGGDKGGHHWLNKLRD